MKRVGLKSDGSSAPTARKRDQQTEEDELWRETSVMKWKKRSVGGDDVYAATLCVCFMCVLLRPCLC